MVRNYQLYLIEDDVAAHYFGREQLLYRLFQEHERSKGRLKQIIQNQIAYITKPLQVLRIHQMIQKQLGLNKGFKGEHGTFFLELNGKVSMAYLKVGENSIWIKASGNYEAETAFFEVLRKGEASFLAIDLDHHRYGWLKPIKERKFV